MLLEPQVEVVVSKSMRTSKSGNHETFIQDTCDTTFLISYQTDTEQFYYNKYEDERHRTEINK